MPADNADGKLGTTETSLQIVELIKELDGARVAEIAAEIDKPTSTVHSHVKTLHLNGYLTKAGDSYHLGGKFFHLGMHMRNSKEVYRVVKNNLHRFVDESHEHADFSIEDHGRNLVLYNEYAIKETSWLDNGVYHYMHQTSSGKAILAELPDERVHGIVDQWGLPAATSHSITDESELMEELDQVRRQGYGLNKDEVVDGLLAVGAPIRNALGEVFGAIAVSGPTYRLDPDEMADRILPIVRDIEDEIDAENLF